MTVMPSALSRFRMLDLTRQLPGPFCSMLLADLGMDVTAVSSPTDPMGLGIPILARNKKSLTLNLKSAEGREVFHRLAREADVVLEGSRPGAAQRLGVDWETLRRVNPRLVYCSISGFGRSSQRPAYDHVVQGATGMTLATGNAGDPPAKIGFPLIDVGAGMLAALAIVSGLRERDRTGEGMLLDVSLAGAALQLMYPMTCEALTDGIDPVRAGSQAFSGSPAADLFATRDGWIAIAANTPRQFAGLLASLDIGHLARDPALFDPPLDPDAPAAFLRAKDAGALKAALGARIASLDAAELEARLTTARVPAARVRTLADFAGEADRDGTLAAVTLEDEGATVRSPGLGFKVL
jgi:crotonobetainyl-CoA:carnitine CoA-transferase CaiB-like acyl-CoA transferase